ncbi:uncharacterized protein LOC110435865 [Sorghum bicolor]|uniref:uncharacterized protein LOC110435865 n=1 Tax=Sorghum bicolor TaxID=4558 RepID=UPI000B423BCC|nr:uncharacterized protein LOC110435865 [Sorghum bicolor]|eukprot:XP_021317624.1 uncharacterized protein LOC110435865 [Sorghum bicolor]
MRARDAVPRVPISTVYYPGYRIIFGTRAQNQPDAARTRSAQILPTPPRSWSAQIVPDPTPYLTPTLARTSARSELAPGGFAASQPRRSRSSADDREGLLAHPGGSAPPGVARPGRSAASSVARPSRRSQVVLSPFIVQGAFIGRAVVSPFIVQGAFTGRAVLSPWWRPAPQPSCIIWDGPARPLRMLTPEKVLLRQLKDLEAHGTYKLVCLQRIVAHCHLLSRASGKNEWQLAWRCCCRCQPTATASPACAPPTLLANPGAPPPDPLPHLGFCTISYSSPFLFLIQFDDRVQDVFPASVNDNC